MRSLKNQSGSVIVFVTLVVVLLLVMVGMGLDTGWLTFSRSVGQRAVDMAALAGAAGVAAGNPAKVKANVEALNSTNDYVAATGNQINGTVNDKNVTLIHYDAKATPTIQLATGVTGTSVGNANGARVALERVGNSTLTYSNTDTSVNTPSFLTPLLNFLRSGGGTPGSTNVNVSAVAVIESQPALPIALNGCDPAWVGTNTEIPWIHAPSGGSNPNH